MSLLCNEAEQLNPLLFKGDCDSVNAVDVLREMQLWPPQGGNAEARGVADGQHGGAAGVQPGHKRSAGSAVFQPAALRLAIKGSRYWTILLTNSKSTSLS